MTRDDHLAYFVRLHILEQMLTDDQRNTLSGMYADIIELYYTLIVNKIDFDILNLDYNLIASSSNPKVKALKKLFYKQHLEGLILWLKKIYNFDHSITAHYNNLPATFSNRDLTLSIVKDNLTCCFVIEKSSIRYVSYSIDNENFLIDESILFKPKQLKIFLDNMTEYHSLGKTVLDMIFLS